MKKKFMVYSLLFIVFLLYTIYHIPYTIYANESTPSSTIQAKLDELKQEIASKAAQLKQEVNQKLQNRAIAGVVQSKDANSITVVDKDGPKTIRISQDTAYDTDLKPNLKYSYKLVEKDDYIVALGEIDDLGALVAQKIMLQSSDDLTPKTILWGQIVAMNRDNVTVRDKNLKDVSVSFAKINIDAKLKDFVIITGYKNKKDVLIASFVHVIPQGFVIKPKKESSPSASPKPSTKPSPPAKQKVTSN